jgi:hypothetical protein
MDGLVRMVNGGSLFHRESDASALAMCRYAAVL